MLLTITTPLHTTFNSVYLGSGLPVCLKLQYCYNRFNNDTMIWLVYHPALMLYCIDTFTHWLSDHIITIHYYIGHVE